jgi:Flp pilus assembly protein TadG
VALAALLLALIAGLVIDLGMAFDQQRQVANLADGAARAAANELNEANFRRTGLVELDPLRAQATAIAWLAPETGQVELLAGSPGGPLDSVRVTVSREAPTSFMRLAGFTSLRITARAVSRLELG